MIRPNPVEVSPIPVATAQETISRLLGREALYNVFSAILPSMQMHPACVSKCPKRKARADARAPAGSELEDADLFAVAADTLKFDLAVDEREEGIVRTDSHVFTRVNVGTALTNQNVARENGLSVRSLDAEALGLGIASVFSGTNTFFMCHSLLHLRPFLSL